MRIVRLSASSSPMRSSSVGAGEDSGGGLVLRRGQSLARPRGGRSGRRAARRTGRREAGTRRRSAGSSPVFLERDQDVGRLELHPEIEEGAQAEAARERVKSSGERGRPARAPVEGAAIGSPVGHAERLRLRGAVPARNGAPGRPCGPRRPAKRPDLLTRSAGTAVPPGGTPGAAGGRPHERAASPTIRWRSSSSSSPSGRQGEISASKRISVFHMFPTPEEALIEEGVAHLP